MNTLSRRGFLAASAAAIGMAHVPRIAFAEGVAPISVAAFGTGVAHATDYGRLANDMVQTLSAVLSDPAQNPAGVDVEIAVGAVDAAIREGQDGFMRHGANLAREALGATAGICLKFMHLPMLHPFLALQCFPLPDSPA